MNKAAYIIERLIERVTNNIIIFKLHVTKYKNTPVTFKMYESCNDIDDIHYTYDDNQGTVIISDKDDEIVHIKLDRNQYTRLLKVITEQIQHHEDKAIDELFIRLEGRM